MAKKKENGKQSESERLFDAVFRGAANEVQELLDQGVSVDSRDDMDRTPLMKAAEAGHADVAEKLIDRGSDINAVDVDGETALMAATYSDHLDVVRLLVSRGADVNVKNSQGSTAVEVAQDLEIAAVATYLAAHSSGSAALSGTESLPNSHEERLTTKGSAEAAVPVNNGEENRRESKDDLATDSERMRDEDQQHDQSNKQAAGLTTGYVDSQKEGSRPEESSDGDSGPREKDATQELTRKSWEGYTDITPGLFTHIAADRQNIPDLSPEEKAQTIKRIVGSSLEAGLHHSGTYLFIYDYKGDLQQVFSKRPNKGKKSFAETARHLDGLISRQQLADCVRGVAFTQEAQAHGLQIQSFSFSHAIALGRLKEAEQRLSLAKEALEKGYTVQQVRDKVRELTTGVPSEDRALGQMAMRRVGDILKLSTDKEIHNFLGNKKRLKSAFKRSDLIRMLDSTEDARKNIHHSVQLLEELENTLVEITAPDRLTGHSDAGDDAESGENQPDED